MSVRRVMGIETEYGVWQPSDPSANAMVLSSQVVHAYRHRSQHPQARAQWDYEDEAPLRDARGWELDRGRAHPTQLTDIVDDPGMANLILSNGARLYVDHAHPEYSSPEVMSPLDAVRWDRAGEQIMLEALREIESSPGLPSIQLYKNNTDSKGASYGTHENYLTPRSVAFADLVTHLTPFFVSRQIFASAGRVSRGQDGSKTGFQISQRADFFEVPVGLETTLKRPIINTRDEPHAVPGEFRRLHVIIGDATQSDVATYLKMGSTSLVLRLIEAGTCDIGQRLALLDPVRALHQISHDPSLQVGVELSAGGTITALDLQWEYLRAVQRHYTGSDELDDETRDILRRWEDTLNQLASDPMKLADQLDWVAKYKLLQAYRERDGLDWDNPRMQMIDLQFSDIRPEKGLFQRLLAKGRMQQLISDADVATAVSEPPHDTRAYFRGKCLAQYPDHVAAASWDSVILDVPGRKSLVRLPMKYPERGTQELTESLFGDSVDVADFVQRIVGE